MLFFFQTVMRLLLFTTLFCTCIANPTVKTKFGDVAGFVATGREGNEADVFLGVPFAKPPIGELRFEKPEPLEPWTGTLNATKFGHVCIPHGRHAAFGHDYSEDCLTLNVVRPKDVDGTLPVLVWIHGGGYQVGSAPWHGYKAFVDNYVHRGIIVVSIQYRLGFLGFFTDGTKNAPGNMGMFDQVMALKWIKENIADFGGDNQDITVWGYSAGASSTSFLTVSPYSRDLFQKSIIMSGSSLSRWSTGHQTPSHSNEFADYIGCSGKDVKKCLKERTIEEMFQAMDHIGLAPPTVDFLKYTPVIDGDFLPKHPYDLMAESPRKPTIMGLSSKEFLFFSGLNLLREIHDVGVESHEIPTIDKDFLWDALDTKILHTEGLDHLKEPIMKLMVEHYIDSKPHNVSDNEFYFNQYNKIFSDTNMNAPIIREMRRRLELGTDVWAYKLEYFNDIMFGEDFPEYAKGSPHVNEYHYLFEMTLIGEIDTTKGIDRDVKEVFMSFIASFVRSGVPKVQDVEWQKVDSPDNIPYLNIAHNLTLKRNLFEEESKLFEDIRKLGFDVVDPTFHVRHAKTEL